MYRVIYIKNIYTSRNMYTSAQNVAEWSYARAASVCGLVFSRCANPSLLSQYSGKRVLPLIVIIKWTCNTLGESDFFSAAAVKNRSAFYLFCRLLLCVYHTLLLYAYCTSPSAHNGHPDLGRGNANTKM